MKCNSEVMKAYEAAKKAKANAHAPYSKFHVGAAIKLLDNPQIFSGCNVENVSFGATVCAERNAIGNAIVSQKTINLEFIVVVSSPEVPVVPCGLCLQVLAEFAKPDLEIYLANDKQIVSKCLYKDLSPSPFNEF